MTEALTCTKGCKAGISYIKTSSGLEIPLYDDKPTTPAINVKLGNNLICYAALTAIPKPDCQYKNALHVIHNSKDYYTSDTGTLKDLSMQNYCSE